MQAAAVVLRRDDGRRGVVEAADEMRPSDYLRTASGIADDRIDSIEFELASLIKAKNLQGAYEKDFLAKCSLLDSGAMARVERQLRLTFGRKFSVSGWRKEVSAEAPPRMEVVSRGWEGLILRNEEGKMLSCHENVALFLENDPAWKGVVGYNEFTGGYIVLKQPPPPITAKVGEELQDHFDTEACRWFERQRLIVKPDTVRRVIDASARKNSFHPVRQYLEALPAWDGTKRTSTWTIDYLGVHSSDTSPNFYAMAVGEKFLISAIARVMQPGCKADHVLILEGRQGIGKSTAVRVLASDEFFSNQLAEMGSKDASMQIRGVWIVELSELDSLGRVEMTRAKGFIDNQVEIFRLPYGKRIVHHPRQCVFMGTTNMETWLKDETGGRRFWPIRCGRIEVESLRRDRDQIWAEALHLYREGQHWWLEDKEILTLASGEQRSRYQDDVWGPEIRRHAEDIAYGLASGDKLGTVSVPEVLLRLGVEIPKQDQALANRVARCLVADGWERWRAPKDEEGRREWRYRRPKSVAPDGQPPAAPVAVRA